MGLSVFKRFLPLLALWLALLPLGHAAPRTILVLGDSLSAGYGIRQDAAWPHLLAQRLALSGANYTVVNLSLSGETTAGGRARLQPALATHQPALVVLALGANDGLRGQSLSALRGNLEAMIDSSRRAGARVLLVGMRLPPNYGPYAEQFARTFAEVARQRQVSYTPFLLDGVAEQTALFQADGLHPTADAQPRILDNVWRALKPLIG